MTASLDDNPLFQRVPCPACGGRDPRRHFETPFSRFKPKASLDYTSVGIGPETVLGVDRCRSCGLVFVNPRIRPEHAGLIYNQCKAGQAAKAVLEPGTPEHRRDLWQRRSRYLPVLLKLVSLSGRQPPLSLLDYGAGHGHTLALARELGLEGYGLDLDQARVERCRGQGLAVWPPGEFEARCGELKADLVTIQSVLEHLVELEGFFAGVERHCRPGTALYINGCAPGLIDRERRQGKLVKANFLEHVNYFTHACLDRFMARFHFAPAAKVPLLLDNRRLWLGRGLWRWRQALAVRSGYLERFYFYRGGG